MCIRDRVEDLMTLEEVSLKADQSEMRMSGKLDLKEPQDFEFKGKVSRFNFAAFGRFPQSDLNLSLIHISTTPFDMVVLNDLDRYHLAGDVIDRLPSLGSRAAYTKQYLRDRLLEHKEYVYKYGEDMPNIRDWNWADGKS